MAEEQFKTIAVSAKTHKRLEKLGNKGDTYEDIIIKLLKYYEKREGGP
jgi:predicted CopG family antitoxin